MTNDDLPWPELGNISRGATRGNQGQKGVLGPPDEQGRCLLQLRVQPGVLEVRLTRQASDWYRLLDSEVTQALKLTKTYWRKARRRQDYDARADQDHMELHEWLQQLKDKVMSHLEMLMQKGDIPGPPYIMPDNIELAFLRKFVERQTAGVPHNPRLREAGITQNPPPPTSQDLGSESPEPGGDPSSSAAKSEQHSVSPSFAPQQPDTSARLSLLSSVSASTATEFPSIFHRAELAMQLVQNARANLLRAQQEVHDTYSKYSVSIEKENKARLEMNRAVEYQVDIMSQLLRQYPMQPSGTGMISSDMSAQRSLNGRMSPSRYQPEAGPSQPRPQDERRGSNQRVGMPTWNESLIDPHLGAAGSSHPPRAAGAHVGQAIDWSQMESLRVDQFQSSEARLMDHDLSRSVSSPQMLSSERVMNGRKHLRSWDQTGMQDAPRDGEDGSVPPRKRMHPLSADGLHVGNNMNGAMHDMPLPSQSVLGTPPTPHFVAEQPHV
ncbi:hypothetical protein GLOTRDRAFT_140832 [Gloeophyllum trabeum ATCC 11539]|uniref:Uncharacterized protein n=1 Tax=Gloeophyllum trabeum (strain ATCC 11539 / FP-39264 / Madison 617) TaxID=670483 RepID=S7RCE2_GLOTA|nr:uncharacterized protein GLOTRDRAFT_140832 [Gloeophyllum trabeum ATCC 11539]EPQ51890.1 hypothetical protein GLOTRDRAFT_140832 [Gloeophyllum trabeum ATCC 11539]